MIILKLYNHILSFKIIIRGILFNENNIVPTLVIRTRNLKKLYPVHYYDVFYSFEKKNAYFKVWI